MLVLSSLRWDERASIVSDTFTILSYNKATRESYTQKSPVDLAALVPLLCVYLVLFFFEFFPFERCCIYLDFDDSTRSMLSIIQSNK